MKLYLFLIFSLMVSVGLAQDISSNLRTKKSAVADTIQLDSVSINPLRFQILDRKGQAIDPTKFSANYQKGYVVLSEDLQTTVDTVFITYTKYPDFLTRDYFLLDPNIIVESKGDIDKLYALQESSGKKNFTPFEGLNTVGSISRGVTVGTNQNAVVNSELDLQITGKLSDKVSIRASIQDANIPTQEGGYSQNLDEFDQIFIELYSKNWNIRAGDVDLRNQNSYFGNFTKKVQGISLSGQLEHPNGSKTSSFASGALVRGVFSKSEFLGQEGNQGPYKLVGPNGELYILIVSGSERVYMNGLLLERGENKDYIIDYNAGEIKFNATYPIDGTMRITVEYQYTDRNYTRFIGYGGGNHSNEKFDIGAYVYSESDAKNQPLQQNLSEEQVNILKNAGDDRDQMIAPSAVADTYSENKILYKKVNLNGIEIFVFSNNPEDDLYSVRFTLVGEGNGNYIISDASAISRIYEYVPPINGVPQGSYEPVIRLTAPEKIQIGGVMGSYHPNERTRVSFELSGSNNDLNLFSSIDDENNDGFASRIDAQHALLKKADTLSLKAFASFDHIDKDFRTIERLYSVEFGRDWNIDPGLTDLGDQNYLNSGLEFNDKNIGVIRYEFQNRGFATVDGSENYEGVRHVLGANVHLGAYNIRSYGSYLNGSGLILDSKFFRTNSTITRKIKSAWIGGKFNLEDNQVHHKPTDSLTPASQEFKAYELFSGIGDSTKVFVELGYRHRVNDSLRNSLLTRVSSSNTYYLKSKLIQTKKAQLSLFANYRELKDEDLDENNEDRVERSLNSRLYYNQSLFDGGIRWNTLLESNNGVIPQQEFSYIKVEPGEGIFVWNDYNNNGIQELDEFEIAQYQDEAEYIRILLPNQIFIKVRENKFSQILTLNTQNWSSMPGFKKVLSHFYNQTSYLIQRKVKRENDAFNINPFEDGGENELGLVLNFRNTLFFNRGKQHYTTSYTFLATSNRNFLSIGLLESTLRSHQILFSHKFWESWLLGLKGSVGKNENFSENFESRNFELDLMNYSPKISYFLNSQTRFDVFYQSLVKKNQLGDMEKLEQQKIGFSFAYAPTQKGTINGEFNYIENNFTGSPFSPVAYQILEGLQPGTNFTWQLLVQKKITKYLDANVSYFGRKSEGSKTIHTGSIQLRAFF